jgi:hypothetical protein
MRVASTAEYKAAGYVWSRMDIGQDTACVLADTWVLLPLESISSGRVVGGGFPIDYQFGQSELAALFEEVKTRPSENTFSRAYELTGADVCWIVVKRAEIAEGGKDLLSGIIGAEPEETDSDVMIWRHILKEE